MKKVVLNVTFILDVILVIVGVILALYCFGFAEPLEEFVSKSFGVMDHADASSVTGGYEVVGGFFGVLLSGFAFLSTIMLGVLGIASSINFFIPALVSMILRCKAKQENNENKLKACFIVNIVFHIIPALFTVSACFDLGEVIMPFLIGAVVFVGIEALNIIAVVK